MISLNRLASASFHKSVYIALLAFVLTRAIVPQGFMPAPLADDVPYTFCHGDLQSAALLNLTEHNPHVEERRSQESSLHDVWQCTFSSLGFSLCWLAAVESIGVFAAAIAPVVKPKVLPPKRLLFSSARSRGPPLSL